MVRNLNEDDWKTLVYVVEQGDCILMLGPDAITEKVDGNSVPLMQLFAEHLRQELWDEKKCSNEGGLPQGANLAQVAQTFKNRLGVNDLRVKARDFFQSKENLKNQFLEDLAALPFKLIINSIPGKHVEKAFQRVPGKSPRSDWYYFATGPKIKNMVHQGTPEEPLIYHLTGCVDDPRSLVLTENDLLDFLVAVISERPSLPNNIGSAFNAQDACFLFLGFGLKNWYLRILLHVLYKRKGENRSFALEKFDDAISAVMVEPTKLFFQEGHKIDFFDMELDDFAAELRRHFEVKQNVAQIQEVELPPNAPKVFLCHASENKNYAQELYAELKREEIQPWLDKEDIRGGAEWDSLIETAITKEIDYFIILQSEIFNQKIESYFNKEIKIALDRQDRFAEKIVFIIPTLIEECKRLERLESLHTIDLTKENGFKDLIKTIKRDYEIRRKRS